MQKVKYFGLIIAFCLLVTACNSLTPTSPPESDSNLAEPLAQEETVIQVPTPVEQEEPEPASVYEAKAEEPELTATTQPATLANETFDSALAQLVAGEFVRVESWSGQSENIALLDEWVENYRRGIPGRVVILYYGGPFPSGLFILESDGSATYRITEYLSTGRWWMDETEQGPPEVFESSFVVRRAYIYIFGYDFPEWYEGSSHRRWGAVHISNYTFDRFSGERLEWNPRTDAPLAGITLAQAEQRVREVYAAVGLDEPMPGCDTRIYFRTVGAMYLGENICYIVYGNSDLEALGRGQHGGSVSAVSLDGRLVFMQDMAHGQWWLWNDAQQEIIMP